MKFALYLLLFLTFTVHAAVYRSVDEFGNVVYSDTPVEGSEEIRLNVAPGYKTPVVPDLAPQVITEQEQTEELEEPNYQVSVVSPEHDQSIRDNAGTVTIEVQVQPELNQERGDLIQFQLDGQVVGQAQPSTSFTLTNIDRGSHIVVASVIDKTGKVLKRSRSVLFHLHRRSLINNPAKVNPNALPPPKPAKASPNAAQ
jgi:hypothetical protein